MQCEYRVGLGLLTADPDPLCSPEMVAPVVGGAHCFEVTKLATRLDSEQRFAHVLWTEWSPPQFQTSPDEHPVIDLTLNEIVHGLGSLLPPGLDEPRGKLRFSAAKNKPTFTGGR